MDPTSLSKFNAYEEHRIGDLMLTHSAAKDYHPSFSGGARKLVQITDILHKVYDETWGSERVEI